MSSVFDTKTGNNQFWQNKKEVPCLFKPEMNSGGNVCSMKNNDDFLKSRINNSSRVNNFFPIEKIRVGPGINKGYDAAPTGGFQQMDTADYAKHRTLDDLRTKINQKETSAFKNSNDWKSRIYVQNDLGHTISQKSRI